MEPIATAQECRSGPLGEAAGGLGRCGRADLQVHTSHGDGMESARQIFDHVERTGLLDVVAVTDHDDVRGALAAQEAWGRGGYHFDFVPGIEVTTRSGHLLALWVGEQIPALRGLDETIERIHEAGGLVVVPHPFSMATRSVGRRALETLLSQGRPETRPDGLEVANPVSVGWDCGPRARRLNRERWHLAETGGSDAHFVEAVGAAYTEFDGRSAAQLCRELEAGRTRGVLARNTPLREIGWRRVIAQQAWGLSVTPRKLVRRKLKGEG
jgi:predicted metal-dependent phosphoesterase TrpH